MNLQPPAIIAAWQRGDIDGAYVWAPAVNALEKDGKVLTDLEQVGQWGAPTLDVWVVRKDFADKIPEVVKAFAKSAIDAQQPYIANPDALAETAGKHQQTGAFRSGVPEVQLPVVKGNTYLSAQQQTAELTGPVNKAIIDTAQFLKEQGKVPAGLPLQPVRYLALRAIKGGADAANLSSLRRLWWQTGTGRYQPDAGKR